MYNRINVCVFDSIEPLKPKQLWLFRHKVFCLITVIFCILRLYLESGFLLDCWRVENIASLGSLCVCVGVINRVRVQYVMLIIGINLQPQFPKNCICCRRHKIALVNAHTHQNRNEKFIFHADAARQKRQTD